MKTIKIITTGTMLMACVNANALEIQPSTDLHAVSSHAAIEETTRTGPEHFVQDTSEKVISIVKSDKSDLIKSNELTNLFLSIADVDFMGKFALGQHWQGLSDKSKLNYLETYKKFMIASYVPKFKKYNNQKFDLKGIKKMDNDQYLVQTDIRTDGPNSAPYNVDYRVKLENGNYKVRDIIAEGVSIITTQRSDFGSIMANGGIDSLNKELNFKTDKATSASPQN